MEKPRQSLLVDLDSLFPDDTITIGNTVLIIHPLNLEQITTMSKQVKALGIPLTEAGITWDNYNQPANIIKIVEVILDNAPLILEEASNIDYENLKVLPLDILLQIVDKIIEVNFRSKELFEKNFKSLTSKLNQGGDGQKKALQKIPSKK